MVQRRVHGSLCTRIFWAPEIFAKDYGLKAPQDAAQPGSSEDMTRQVGMEHQTEGLALVYPGIPDQWQDFDQ